MTRKTPPPRTFDNGKFKQLIGQLPDRMTELEFDRACEPVIFDILKNYERFEIVEHGPEYWGRPFDFLGFRKGLPYVIEFNGGLDSFGKPDPDQRARLHELLHRVEGLNIALLQINLKKGLYRLLYNDEMERLLDGEKAAIEPIADWLEKRLAKKS